MVVSTKQIFTSSVSSKGQITLPVEFRKALEIEPKDVVVIALENGTITIETAKSRLNSIYQAVPALEQPLDWNEITRAAWDDFAERNVRTGLPDTEVE